MGEEGIIKKFIESKDYLWNSTVHRIEKGWSNNDKYMLDTGVEKYLLTIFEPRQYDQKVKQLEVMEKLKALEVSVPKPIEIVKDENHGYMVVTYIEGQDGEESLKVMGEEAQYRMGIEAGKELKKMHRLAAPKEIGDWYERKKNKHLKYMSWYNESKIRLKNEGKIIAFMEKHMDLMIGRPNLFQHDDFHGGNIIVKNGKIAGVIDFDSMDWGDPIHEFVKIGTISRFISIPFSMGQIHGYLGTSKPSESFWRLYALYHGMTAISTVVWAQRFHGDRVEEAMEGTEEMLEDHDYFDRIIPKWYTDTLKYRD